MGLFKRMTSVVASHLNAALDDAEDPAKSLDQAVHGLEESLRQARQHQAQALAAAKLAEKQLQSVEARAKDAQDKAVAAVKAGRDDLARAALERKADADREVEEARQGAKAHAEGASQLAASVAALTQQVTEAHQHRNKLAARLAVAQAKRQKEEAAQPATRSDALEDSSTLDEFERIRDKIDHQEALAEAHAELEGPVPGAGEAAAQPSPLAAVDDPLAALKKKMGLG
jgi:phage shock protein A